MDFIIIGIIVLIVGLAAFYVISQKRKGAKCIGCPHSPTGSKPSGGCNCSHKD